MKLVKTEIAGFDEFCNGGLPPGMILLYGEPGSGNEVFAQQILHAKARSGEKVTYCSITASPEALEDDMAIYEWDLASSKQKGNWRCIDLREAKSPFVRIQTELKEGRWIAIDSFSDLLLSYDLNEVIPLLYSLSLHARQHERLHLLLLTKGMQNPQIETALQHLADGVINVIFTEETQGARYVMVKKMRRTILPTRSLPFIIDETGIVIETAMRIT